MLATNTPPLYKTTFSLHTVKISHLGRNTKSFPFTVLFVLSETSAALTVVMEGRAASNSNPETQAFFELRLNYLEWMAMRGYLLHLQHGRVTFPFTLRFYFRRVLASVPSRTGRKYYLLGGLGAFLLLRSNLCYEDGKVEAFRLYIV